MKRKIVLVKCKDTGVEYPVNEFVNFEHESLVDHRIFPSLQDMQCTLLVLKSNSKYALEHGLSCPYDLRAAVKYIEGLEKYE